MVVNVNEQRWSHQHYKVRLSQQFLQTRAVSRNSHLGLILCTPPRAVVVNHTHLEPAAPPCNLQPYGSESNNANSGAGYLWAVHDDTAKMSVCMRAVRALLTPSSHKWTIGAREVPIENIHTCTHALHGTSRADPHSLQPYEQCVCVCVRSLAQTCSTTRAACRARFLILYNRNRWKVRGLVCATRAPACRGRRD